MGGGGGWGERRKSFCASTPVSITSVEPNFLTFGIKAHYERGTEFTFGIKGPGSSGVVLMLSRAI